MNICVDCKKEMKCIHTGTRVRYGLTHVYAGDKFECPECHCAVVVCNTNPYYDPDPKVSIKDLLMEDEC